MLSLVARGSLTRQRAWANCASGGTPFFFFTTLMRRGLFFCPSLWIRGVFSCFSQRLCVAARPSAQRTPSQPPAARASFGSAACIVRRERLGQRALFLRADYASRALLRGRLKHIMRSFCSAAAGAQTSPACGQRRAAAAPSRGHSAGFAAGRAQPSRPRLHRALRTCYPSAEHLYKSLCTAAPQAKP